MAEPDPLQRRGGVLSAAGDAYSGIQQGVGDVVQRGLVLGEEELLEHEPDAPCP